MPRHSRFCVNMELWTFSCHEDVTNDCANFSRNVDRSSALGPQSSGRPFVDAYE